MARKKRFACLLRASRLAKSSLSLGSTNLTAVAIETSIEFPGFGFFWQATTPQDQRMAAAFMLHQSGRPQDAQRSVRLNARLLILAGSPDYNVRCSHGSSRRPEVLYLRRKQHPVGADRPCPGLAGRSPQRALFGHFLQPWSEDLASDGANQTRGGRNVLGNGKPGGGLSITGFDAIKTGVLREGQESVWYFCRRHWIPVPGANRRPLGGLRPVHNPARDRAGSRGARLGVERGHDSRHAEPRGVW